LKKYQISTSVKFSVQKLTTLTTKFFGPLAPSPLSSIQLVSSHLG